MGSMTPETPRPKPDTGEVCRDLPSPYLADTTFGLLHLPRFLGKIRKHLAGELPKSYQRNFTKGFDGFLCAHLGVEAADVIAAVKECGDDEAALKERLRAMLPADVQAPKWNRKLAQTGMRGMGKEALEDAKKRMGIADREDLICFADMIEFDEDRLP